MAPRTVKEYQLALCTMNVKLPSGKQTLAEYKSMYESAIASLPPVSATAPAPGSARGKRRQSEITISPAAPTPKSSKRRAQSVGNPSALATPLLPHSVPAPNASLPLSEQKPTLPHSVPAPNANLPLSQQKPAPQNANVRLGMQSPLQNPSVRHSTQQHPQIHTEQLRMSPPSADMLSSTQQPLENSNVPLRMQTSTEKARREIQPPHVPDVPPQPLQNSNVPLGMQTSTENVRQELQPPHVPDVPPPSLSPSLPPLPAPDQSLSPDNPYDFSPQPAPVEQPFDSAPISPATLRRYLCAFTSSKKLLHLLALLALLLAVGIGLTSKTAGEATASVSTLKQIAHVSPMPTTIQEAAGHQEAAEDLDAAQADAFPAGGWQDANASYAEVEDKDEGKIESPVDGDRESTVEHVSGGEDALPSAMQAAGESSDSVDDYSRPDQPHPPSVFSLFFARFCPFMLQEILNSLGAALSPRRFIHLLGDVLGFILENVSSIFLQALRSLGGVMCHTPEFIYNVIFLAIREPQKALALPLIVFAAFFVRRVHFWRLRRKEQRKKRIDEAMRWLVTQLREHHEAWSSASPGAGRYLSPAALHERIRAERPDLLDASGRMWAEIEKEMRAMSCVQVVSNSQSSEESWDYAPM